jgi:hypothetical protein
MRVGAANPLPRIRGWFQKIQANFLRPLHVLRLCRRRTEFLSIVNEATHGASPWPPDLVERVVQYVLEDGNADLSVYASATADPLDLGHALGVIAEGITQQDFQPSARKRAKGCTRGTLLIPINFLSGNARLKFTPQHNLNFFPADERHYDLSIRDARELATSVLEGIHNRAIHWTSLGNDGSYRVQAAIAYSYCLSRFGKLDDGNPPSKWRNGKDLASGVQIEILKHLANVAIIDSPLQ